MVKLCKQKILESKKKQHRINRETKACGEKTNKKYRKKKGISHNRENRQTKAYDEMMQTKTTKRRRNSKE